MTFRFSAVPFLGLVFLTGACGHPDVTNHRDGTTGSDPSSYRLAAFLALEGSDAAATKVPLTTAALGLATVSVASLNVNLPNGDVDSFDAGSATSVTGADIATLNAGTWTTFSGTLNDNAGSFAFDATNATLSAGSGELDLTVMVPADVMNEALATATATVTNQVPGGSITVKTTVQSVTTTSTCTPNPPSSNSNGIVTTFTSFGGTYSGKDPTNASACASGSVTWSIANQQVSADADGQPSVDETLQATTSDGDVATLLAVFTVATVQGNGSVMTSSDTTTDTDGTLERLDDAATVQIDAAALCAASIAAADAVPSALGLADAPVCPAPPTTSSLVNDLANANVNSRGPIATSAQTVLTDMIAVNAAYGALDKADPKDTKTRLAILKNLIVPAQQTLLTDVITMQGQEGFGLQPTTLPAVKAQLLKKQQYQAVLDRLGDIIKQNQAILANPPALIN